MNLLKKNVKILIPAAGFGIRVGRPPAKELFLRHDTNKPMIDWTLQQVVDHNFYATVITRKDKTTLIDYLQSHPNYNKNFDICLIESSSDWQDSILKAYEHWMEFNFVLLPDTTWEPKDILQTLFQDFTQINSISLIAGLHTVLDPQKWGIVCINHHQEYFWCEKPNLIPTEYKILGAWGIFGFKKSMGENFLTKQIHSQNTKNFFKISEKIKIFNLSYFKDLTRE